MSLASRRSLSVQRLQASLFSSDIILVVQKKYKFHIKCDEIMFEKKCLKAFNRGEYFFLYRNVVDNRRFGW